MTKAYIHTLGSLFLLGILLFPRSAGAQLISGDIFLRGKYIEVGLGPNGCFGTRYEAPAGYHARSGAGYLAPPKALGFVADPDQDGWATGRPAYFGDYFLPEGPMLTWAIEIDSSRYRVSRDILGAASLPPGLSGSNTDYFTTGSTRHGIWQGAIGNLNIKQDTYFDTNALYFVVRIQLRNTGAGTLKKLYYLQAVNPDNDHFSGAVIDYRGLATKDTIVFQTPNTESKSLVTARGVYTNAYLGLGAKDCRAKVFRYGDELLYRLIDTAGSIANIYRETPRPRARDLYAYSGGGALKNGCIGIVFHIDSLKPGDSTSFAYTYILKQEYLDSAFLQVKSNWVYQDRKYNSGDTIRACAGATLAVTIDNGGAYNWNSWSPATGLAATSGSSNTITAGSSPVTYRAIGSSTDSACGGFSDTLYLTIDPLPAPAAPKSLSSTYKYCEGDSAAMLMASTGTLTDTLLWYTSPAGGIPSLSAPIPSTSVAGTKTWYVSARNTRGCEGPRTAIPFTVTPTPREPRWYTHDFCQGSTGDTVAAKGTNLLWYTADTGGVGKTVAPAPNTATPGDIYNYVSQTIDGCESERAAVHSWIKPTPAKPLVTDTVRYCQGAVTTALTATGINLKWYTTDSGGIPGLIAPVPSAATSGYTTYYVSQVMDTIWNDVSYYGCEGPRAAITVAIQASPAPPVVSSPLHLCKGAPDVTLSATGSGLKWYNAPSAGTGTSAAPVVTTAATGSTVYYVSQSLGGTAGTCEGTRAALNVIVNPNPDTPAAATSIIYCQGAAASALSAAKSSATDTLKWYNSTPALLPGAPTPLTTAAGVSTYSVSIRSAAGCEGPKTSIRVMVNPTPEAPTVSTPVVYCQGLTATALTATKTMAADTLKWYNAVPALLPGAPVPATTAAGSTTYYVSEKTGPGCESPKAAIIVQVNPTPALPATTTPVIYCQGAAATSLTASPAVPGDTLKWYNSKPVLLPDAPIPGTATTGNTTYYVSAKSNAGCEGAKKSITVTVNPTPAAPVATTPLAYCIDDPATALSATKASSTDTLKWYDATPALLGTAPVPGTAATGSTTYYVSNKTAKGCEGPKTTIIVNVNPRPAAPAVSTPLGLCTGVPADSLRASGINLKWYTLPGGGTATTFVIPATSTAGSGTWYVSQTSALGCEGPRAALLVQVRPSPVVNIRAMDAPAFVYCHGDSMTLKAFSSTATAYQWYRDTVLMPGSSRDSIVVSSSADYRIVVHDVYGCTDTASVAVIENPLPVPVLSPTDVYICPGVDIMLYARPATAGYRYEWYKDGVPMSIPLSDHQTPVSERGTYSVIVTDNYNCVLSTNNATISTYPVMTAPVIDRSGAVLRLRSTYTSYQWYRNGKPITGANARTYTMSFDGDYHVIVTDANGCMDTSDRYEYQGLGINTPTANQAARLFPNPSTGKITIEAAVPVNVRVTDLSGRLILEQQRVSVIDLAPFADGLYWFTVTDNSGNRLLIEQVNKQSGAY